MTILEGSKFYFQIEDISIWHDTPSELLLTFVLKKSSGQDGQLCYGSEPPCAPNRHWHCHSFSGLLGWSLDNSRSCNYLRVSTVFYPYAYHAWYAKFKPHIFYSPEIISSHSFDFPLRRDSIVSVCVAGHFSFFGVSLIVLKSVGTSFWVSLVWCWKWQ